MSSMLTCVALCVQAIFDLQVQTEMKADLQVRLELNADRQYLASAVLSDAQHGGMCVWEIAP